MRATVASKNQLPSSAPRAGAGAPPKPHSVDASIKLSQVSHQILSHLVNGFSLTQLWISLMVLKVRLFLSWVWL